MVKIKAYADKITLMNWYELFKKRKDKTTELNWKLEILALSPISLKVRLTKNVDSANLGRFLDKIDQSLRNQDPVLD